MKLSILKSTRLLTSALTLALTACGKAGTDGNAGTEMPNSEAQSLLATHAFDTPAPMKAVAFSPNNVASWLGAIAMVSEAGDLYITNIEGVRPKSVGSVKFNDVIGLAQSQQPGLFLAITESGDMKAFIEADDESNFKAIPLSSSGVEVARFCDGPKGEMQTLYTLSAKGIINRLDISVDDNNAVKLGTAKPIGGVTVKGVSGCVHDGNNTVFIVNGGSNPQLHVMRDGELSKRKLSLSSGKNLSLAYIEGDSSPSLLAINSSGGNVAALYDAATLQPVTDIAIEPGFSIGGLSAASGIYATTSGFGGSAFKDGIIVFGDSEDNRVVVLSRSYFLGEVK